MYRINSQNGLLTCLGRATSSTHGQNRTEGCRGSGERPRRDWGPLTSMRMPKTARP